MWNAVAGALAADRPSLPAPGALLIFRSLAESGLDPEQVRPLLPDGQVGVWVGADDFLAGLARGDYRAQWAWVAQDEGRPCAIALWWGPVGAGRPGALDSLHVDPDVGGDRVDVAARLLAAGQAVFAEAGQGVPPDYHVLLPADWRDRPDAVAELAWRREAARRVGLSAELERLRYEWTADRGVPEPSRRLRFRAEPDDEVFVDLFRRVLEGTLDAGSRAEAERLGAEAQARADVAFYRDDMSGDRSWWRIAETPDGRTVGFALPSSSPTAHVVGYLGVLPGHRGHGYVDDLLAEITRFLAQEEGARLVRADTDLPNRPMAAAFERLGYRNFARRLVLSAP